MSGKGIGQLMIPTIMIVKLKFRNMFVKNLSERF
jgi:hypothetical protein